jgi:hypothetical protein
MELAQSLWKSASRSLAIAAMVITTAACAGRAEIRTTAENPALVATEQLWTDPVDLDSRDLFHGPGGPTLAPSPSGVYQFIKADNTGYSRGYDVRDAEGTTWSVKIGPEAQPEIVASRILWALGYHQPSTYLLTSWQLVGAENGAPGPARFRREDASQKVVDEWSWYENPFAHTQPFKGLVVASLILNNWDWKTSNNKVYEVDGGDGQPRRIYVVRDLGASLGKTTFPAMLRWTPLRGFGQGSRNDLADFEEQGFIKSFDGEEITFDYRGIHQRLVDTLTVEDVLWTCRRLARLSDAQWRGAFAAAGYREDEQQRFIAKMKSKVQEGLALESGAEGARNAAQP